MEVLQNVFLQHLLLASSSEFIMSKKPKFYVVWQGFQPGVYDNWNDCAHQVKGFPNARYKAFYSRDAAEQAFQEAPEQHIGQKVEENQAQGATSKSHHSLAALSPHSPKERPILMPSPDVLEKVGFASMVVDAACAKNPGPMEYRGIYLGTGEEIFHYGPVLGTNNIGEFLAIVHALALIEKQGLKGITIYSDSRTAISWVRRKQCKTTLEKNERTAPLFDMIARAEQWLKARRVTTRILKWETREWGEIPADFGRK